MMLKIMGRVFLHMCGLSHRRKIFRIQSAAPDDDFFGRCIPYTRMRGAFGATRDNVVEISRIHYSSPSNMLRK